MVFVGKVFHQTVKSIFHQTVGFPIDTNCVPFRNDIFLYSHEVNFIQSLFSTGKKQVASRFNPTYRYIDDVLSINSHEIEYPAELKIKDTTERITSASYLQLLLSIGRDCLLHTSMYDKRNDFNFVITNFPFLKQGYLLIRLRSSFRFYGRYGDLILQYEVSFSRILNDTLELGQLYCLPNQSDFTPMS